MKKLFSPLLIILYSMFQFTYLQAQNNIGIGTTTPNAKALLDLTANDKGLLVPRVTTTQRIAINPVGNADASLLVYDTNDSLFYFWNSAQWVPFPQEGGSNNIALNFDANTGVLSLTDNGGTLTTNIPPDNDSDPNNELITNVVFNANGNILTINEGGNTWSTAISIVDPDSDPANEFNTALSFNANTNILSVTDAGGTINTDLSSLSNNWKLLGNAGTNPATNFLGTTDNQDLVFRTNNSEKARVLSNGDVGIGTATPSAKLEVFGGGIHTINNGYSVNNVFAYSSGPEHPVFMGIRGGGTFTAPSYPTSGKLLNTFIGRDALDYLNPSSYGGASIYMEATENFSFTNKGTCIRFRTTSNGSNIESEKVVIQQDGSVGIGTPSPVQKLDVNGNIRSQTGAFVSGQRADFYLLLQSDRNMVLYDNGAAVWQSGTGVSDIRTKTNIRPLEEVLPTLKTLSAIRFNYKKELDMGDEEHIGVIAQEIKEHFPDFVYHDEKSDRYLVFYDKLTTVLLKGIQEQQAQIEGLKATNSTLQLENDRIKSSDKEQQQMIDTLTQDNVKLKSVVSAKAEVSDIEKLKTEIQYLKDTLLKAEK